MMSVPSSYTDQENRERAWSERRRYEDLNEDRQPLRDVMRSEGLVGNVTAHLNKLGKNSSTIHLPKTTKQGQIPILGYRNRTSSSPLINLTSSLSKPAQSSQTRSSQPDSTSKSQEDERRSKLASRLGLVIPSMHSSIRSDQSAATGFHGSGEESEEIQPGSGVSATFEVYLSESGDASRESSGWVCEEIEMVGQEINMSGSPLESEFNREQEPANESSEEDQMEGFETQYVSLPNVPSLLARIDTAETQPLVSPTIALAAFVAKAKMRSTSRLVPERAGGSGNDKVEEERGLGGMGSARRLGVEELLLRNDVEGPAGRSDGLNETSGSQSDSHDCEVRETPGVQEEPEQEVRIASPVLDRSMDDYEPDTPPPLSPVREEIVRQEPLLPIRPQSELQSLDRMVSIPSLPRSTPIESDVPINKGKSNSTDSVGTSTGRMHPVGQVRGIHTSPPPQIVKREVDLEREQAQEQPELVPIATRRSRNFTEEEMQVEDALFPPATPMASSSLVVQEAERRKEMTIDTSDDRMRELREKLMSQKKEKRRVEEEEMRMEVGPSSTVQVHVKVERSIETGFENEKGDMTRDGMMTELSKSTRKGKKGTEGESSGKKSTEKRKKRKGASTTQSTNATADGTRRQALPQEDDQPGSGSDREGDPPSEIPAGNQPIPSERRFQPIGESIYVPHSLKHPFRLYEDGTAFDISDAVRAKLNTHTVPNEEYFEIASMAACEYTSRMPEFTDVPSEQRKLLVLDLNGCLVVRSKHGKGRNRSTHKRPFLPSFLNYLMAPGKQSRVAYDATGKLAKTGREPNGDDEQGLERMRPYEAFVWSSAQPENVWGMVATAFGTHWDTFSPVKSVKSRSEVQWTKTPPGDRPGRLLGIWDRTSLGLSALDFGKKSRTSKDLTKILTAFEDTHDNPNSDHKIRDPDPYFSPQIFNTLLLDDSVGETAKSGSQPWNHVPLPAYEIEHKERDLAFVSKAAHANDISLKGDERTFDDTKEDMQAAFKERVAILSASFGSSAVEFYEAIQDGRPMKTSIDASLLAIVGILSELSDVLHVPAWIASGGLMPDVSASFTKADAEKGWEHIVGQDLSLPALSKKADGKRDWAIASLWQRNLLNNASDLPNLDASSHSAPSLPPSHPDYQHWFNSPLHVLYWIRRGMLALDERGVAIDHGLQTGEAGEGAARDRGSSPMVSDRPRREGTPRVSNQGTGRDLEQGRLPTSTEAGPSHTRYSRSPSRSREHLKEPEKENSWRRSPRTSGQSQPQTRSQTRSQINATTRTRSEVRYENNRDRTVSNPYSEPIQNHRNIRDRETNRSRSPDPRPRENEVTQGGGRVRTGAETGSSYYSPRRDGYGYERGRSRSPYQRREYGTSQVGFDSRDKQTMRERERTGRMRTRSRSRMHDYGRRYWNERTPDRDTYGRRDRSRSPARNEARAAPQSRDTYGRPPYPDRGRYASSHTRFADRGDSRQLSPHRRTRSRSYPPYNSLSTYDAYDSRYDRDSRRRYRSRSRERPRRVDRSPRRP